MNPGRNDPCPCGSGKKYKRCCLSGQSAQKSTGKIDILNVGMGHNEIRIDSKNPIELERGSRVIEDMLKRGYALFVHGKGDVLIRVKRFDKKQKVYIIGSEAQLTPEVEAVALPVLEKRGRGRPAKEKSVPMGAAHVTSVGRSAGG